MHTTTMNGSQVVRTYMYMYVVGCFIFIIQLFANLWLMHNGTDIAPTALPPCITMPLPPCTTVHTNI